MFRNAKRPVGPNPTEERKVSGPTTNSWADQSCPPASTPSGWYDQEPEQSRALTARRNGYHDRVAARPPRIKPGKKPKGKPGDITINTYELASKAWKASKYIMSMINVEQKFFDITGNGPSVQAGSIVNLTNIAEGSDYANRDGNSILLQSIDFTAFQTFDPAAAAVWSRIMIICDTMQRGTDPTLGEILENNGALTNIISPVLHYTESRFQVLCDRTFYQGIYVNTGFNFSFSRKLHQHVFYTSTTGADSSNWKGALYLVFMSSVTANPPTLYYYNRLRFTDN